MDFSSTPTLETKYWLRHGMSHALIEQAKAARDLLDRGVDFDSRQTAVAYIEANVGLRLTRPEMPWRDELEGHLENIAEQLAKAIFVVFTPITNGEVNEAMARSAAMRGAVRIDGKGVALQSWAAGAGFNRELIEKHVTEVHNVTLVRMDGTREQITNGRELLKFIDAMRDPTLNSWVGELGQAIVSDAALAPGLGEAFASRTAG